jgi:hypothetical protein
MMLLLIFMPTEAVLQKAMRLIAVASAGSRISEISRLTKLAERITEIQATQQKLELEVQRLTAELEQVGEAPDGRAASTGSSIAAIRTTEGVHENPVQVLGPLAIDIDWAAAGKPYPKQTICERKASDTLRVFFETILQRFGDATLEKLAVLRVNRAPPLSRRPDTEFLNRKRGIPYQHQRVGASEWHVLTHSSTPEKIEIVRQVAQALRFPPGAIKAREIDVQQEIMKLLTSI